MRRVHPRYPLLAVLALCLVGVVGGGDAATDATYVELRLLGEVLGIIADQYVDPVPFTKLVDDAIVGTLRGIDPDGGYLDRDALRELADASAPRSGDVGLEVTRRGDVFEVVTALRGTPAARADIHTGDRIVKIDAVDTSGLQLWQAMRRMVGAPGTTVTLTVTRDGWPEPKDVTLAREERRGPPVRGLDLQAGVLDVEVRRWTPETPREVRRALEQHAAADRAGLVLDLRNAPGGSIEGAVEVAGLFLDRGQLVTSSESRRADERRPFVADGATVERDLPIAVLVNAGTASASEIVAGALQDWNRAVLVGTRTFGRGSWQSLIPLSDGSAVRLATARSLTPTGHAIEGRGITPDLVVAMPVGPDRAAAAPPDVPDLRRDPQLRRALEVITAARILERGRTEEDGTVERDEPVTRP